MTIEHDVKAQNLKTQTILNIVRLAAPIDMPHGRLARDQRLDYYVFDLFF